MTVVSTEKQCLRCERTLSVGQFHKNNARKDGLCAYYKDCIAKYGKAHNSKPETRQKRIDRESQPEYRESMRESWRLASRRRVSTPQGRIDRTISCSISAALSSSGGKGGRSWQQLVGYTLDELIAHLEHHFLPGMTWDNYGIHGWHVDHVIPKSMFKYESPNDDDFRKCWSLENLQPLWAEDNLRKNNRMEISRW